MEEKPETYRVPQCYRIGKNGFCEGLWSNNYWSHKKCRFCGLFPIGWCGNCKHSSFHGPHLVCNKKYGMPTWIPQKNAAWFTRKVDLDLKPILCYERI